jgi:beta,beta-carotene 9',10'-dioxygenase
MRPGHDAAATEVLLPVGFEFPSISDQKHNGQKYRVAFGARIQAQGIVPSGSLVRAELESGERRFEREGYVFGEPTFVARPGASDECDGVVLAVGSHVNEARSALVVLDARSFEPTVWAEVPLFCPARLPRLVLSSLKSGRRE